MFEIWQCQEAACRLRFPAAVGEQPARCPLCEGQLAPAVVPFPSPVQATAVTPHPFPLSALLDNIRSLHNVGSIFRTADGAGLAHLYLCGITATPANPRLAKAALGAQQSVFWSHHRNGLETAVSLKQQGQALWAIESTQGSLPLFQTYPRLTRPTVLVVGNEKAGVDPGILAHCDHIFSLPMHGQKSSLNAAVAFGIAAYTVQFSQAAYPGT